MSISHPVAVWVVWDQRLNGTVLMGIFSTQTLAEEFTLKAHAKLEQSRIVEYFLDEAIA